MEDRQSAKPGRIKLTFDDGTVKYAIMERADNPTVIGTPLGKATLFNQKNTERYVADTPSEAFELIGKVWGPITLTASGWEPGTDGYYVQSAVVSNMSDKFYPAKVPIYTSAELKDDEKVAHSMVDIIETKVGAIVAKATEAPDVDITFLLTGV